MEDSVWKTAYLNASERTKKCLDEMKEQYDTLATHSRKFSKGQSRSVPALFIIVLGKTGAGKSSLIEGITGATGLAGDTLGSGRTLVLIDLVVLLLITHH